jgi:probable F420-dependent oxidoreductase
VVRAFCESAEQLGYHSLWAQERLLRPTDPGSRYAGVAEVIPPLFASVLAPTELLAAVASWTETIRIGTSVLVAGYHQPVELAKRLATLDVLSGGRLDVGIGVGWSDEEHLVSGVDPRTRGARCDEMIEALLACWGEDPVEHEGRFFSIPPSEIGPKPLQEPHPPLLFGMWSEAGLDRTARWADGWLPSGHSVRWVTEQRELLNAKRPPGLAPVRVHQVLFLQPPVPTLQPRTIAQIAEQAAQCAAAGIDGVIIEMSLWPELTDAREWIRAPERLLPVLEAVGAPR